MEIREIISIVTSPVFIFCRHAVEITEKHFKEYAVKKQDFLGDDEKMDKVMQIIGEGDILWVDLRLNILRSKC